VGTADGGSGVDLLGRGARLTGYRLLVTGAGGQLGRAVAELRPDAILLTRDDLDVTDSGAVTAVVARHAPDVILHAAAWTAVDDAERDPDAAWAVNVGGTEAIARVAAGAGALLVYPSTDYVFSGDASRPYREGDATKPRSAYGRTKLEGENAARTCPRHLIVRSSWIFGAGRNFVRAIVERSREGGIIEVVADQVGRPTYALDLARGLLDLAGGGYTKTFHLAGGGDPCSWADLAEAVLEAAARTGLLVTRARVKGVTTEEWAGGRSGPVAARPRYSVLDCSRAESVGVRLPPWRDALEEYVNRLAADAGEDRA
jgi:dTDP-4-dehydrorhamnose reductase